MTAITQKARLLTGLLLAILFELLLETEKPPLHRLKFCLRQITFVAQCRQLHQLVTDLLSTSSPKTFSLEARISASDIPAGTNSFPDISLDFSGMA